MSGRRALMVLGAAGLAGAAVVAGRSLADREPQVWSTPEGRPAGDVTGAPGGLVSRSRTAPGARGAAQVAPPSWEPELLSALARWEPARPSTPVLRALTYAWASPLTLLGLLAGVAAGVAPRPRDGVLVFSGARGLPSLFFGRRGYAAFAMGHVIVAAAEEPSSALLVHELVHVRQAERLGPLMAPVYVALHALYGYARHPMERAARRAQRRALGVPDARRQPGRPRSGGA